MMSNFVLNTPVIFIIFNRPDTTIKVFEKIRMAKPPKLLVIADGPRKEKGDEAERCLATRAIIDLVDWDCEVLTNFSDVNMGCKKRVSSGLDWAFGLVEEAIILEDDCLPEITFFAFCQELLERYRYDNRIMIISGDNFHNQEAYCETYSYYYSQYPHIWGWASWRRVWNLYDVSMRMWSEVKAGQQLQDIFDNKNELRYWQNAFEGVATGKIDTWDYQFCFMCMAQHGLNIMPSRNLVSNIGFGVGATHTGDATSRFANMDTYAMDFPLQHPPVMVRNKKYDVATAEEQYSTRNILSRILYKVRTLIG